MSNESVAEVYDVYPEINGVFGHAVVRRGSSYTCVSAPGQHSWEVSEPKPWPYEGAAARVIKREPDHVQTVRHNWAAMRYIELCMADPLWAEWGALARRARQDADEHYAAKGREADPAPAPTSVNPAQLRQQFGETLRVISKASTLADLIATNGSPVNAAKLAREIQAIVGVNPSPVAEPDEQQAKLLTTIDALHTAVMRRAYDDVVDMAHVLAGDGLSAFSDTGAQGHVANLPFLYATVTLDKGDIPRVSVSSMWTDPKTTDIRPGESIELATQFRIEQGGRDTNVPFKVQVSLENDTVSPEPKPDLMKGRNGEPTTPAPKASAPPPPKKQTKAKGWMGQAEVNYATTPAQIEKPADLFPHPCVNAYGDTFRVGDRVQHEDNLTEGTAVIQGFEHVPEFGSTRVWTNKGYADLNCVKHADPSDDEATTVVCPMCDHEFPNPEDADEYRAYERTVREEEALRDSDDPDDDPPPPKKPTKHRPETELTTSAGTTKVPLDTLQPQDPREEDMRPFRRGDVQGTIHWTRVLGGDYVRVEGHGFAAPTRDGTVDTVDMKTGLLGVKWQSGTISPVAWADVREVWRNMTRKQDQPGWCDQCGAGRGAVHKNTCPDWRAPKEPKAKQEDAEVERMRQSMLGNLVLPAGAMRRKESTYAQVRPGMEGHKAHEIGIDYGQGPDLHVTHWQDPRFAVDHAEMVSDMGKGPGQPYHGPLLDMEGTTIVSGPVVKKGLDQNGNVWPETIEMDVQAEQWLIGVRAGQAADSMMRAQDIEAGHTPSRSAVEEWEWFAASLPTGVEDFPLTTTPEPSTLTEAYSEERKVIRALLVDAMSMAEVRFYPDESGAWATCAGFMTRVTHHTDRQWVMYEATRMDPAREASLEAVLILLQRNGGRLPDLKQLRKRLADFLARVLLRLAKQTEGTAYTNAPKIAHATDVLYGAEPWCDQPRQVPTDFAAKDHHVARSMLSYWLQRHWNHGWTLDPSLKGDAKLTETTTTGIGAQSHPVLRLGPGVWLSTDGDGYVVVTKTSPRSHEPPEVLLTTHPAPGYPLAATTFTGYPASKEVPREQGPTAEALSRTLCPPQPRRPMPGLPWRGALQNSCWHDGLPVCLCGRHTR